MKGNQAPKRTIDRTYNIEIQPASKKHLRFFIKNELEYFNGLISNITMTLRAFPEDVLSLREGYENLWNTLAFNDLSVRELNKLESNTWPTAINIAVPSIAIKDNRLAINERKMLVFDALNVRGRIHPQVRKNIAAEVLKTILPQAEQLVRGQKDSNGEMQAPVHMLMPMAYPEKRHLQLTRDLVKMVWDSERKQSVLSIPYTDRPLIIKYHNITDDRWDLLVLRQRPHTDVNEESPWQATFIPTPKKYLLDLTDQHVNLRKRKAA